MPLYRSHRALQLQSFYHQICCGFVELLVSYQRMSAEGDDYIVFSASAVVWLHPKF